uniref:Uncharacterized protein n=1 Tax=viral metagenome TaxID=1070528 RepID=A0A6C0HVI4_9ZZZZ
MNYIISSIVLLSIIMIIIYILSIDNNMHKLKNKLNELFSVVKSKKVNYLNDKDNKNLLEFIKQNFNSDDNIIIPSKIFYDKTDNGFEMNNINIICYKYNNNKFDEIPYKINILFVPFEKDNYISNQTLFNLHGNYKLEIVEDTKKKVEEKRKSVQFSEKQEIINETFISADHREMIATETYTDVLDMIPDIIRLSETEENIDNDTTDTIELISHNLK